MASRQLWGCGVHALQVLLLLLLLLLLPLRVTPGRERLESKQGSRGGPEQPAELDPWGSRLHRTQVQLEVTTEGLGGFGVQDTWRQPRRAQKKMRAPCLTPGWLPSSLCKGVERPH